MTAQSAAPSEPASTADVLAEMDIIGSAVTRFAQLAGDARSWSGDVRAALLGRLDRAVDCLTAARGAILLAERESGAWQDAADGSFEGWRGRTGGTGRRVAAAQVRQAVQLDAVPAVAAAVTSGRIGLEHATIIGKLATTGTPAQREAVLSAAVQEHLLDLAQRVDSSTFAGSVARLAATIDPPALERDHERQRAERFLHVTTCAEGTFIKGRLDSTAGNRLAHALEALSPRPAVEDDRDAAQRRADALDAMASRILALADTKPGAHVPPQVTMIVSAETWRAARAERDRRRHRPPEPADAAPHGARPGTREGETAAASRGASRDAGSTGHDNPSIEHDDCSTGQDDAARSTYQPATLEDGTPVPISELAAAMCDCEITRLVVDAEGVPLDLGRAERVFTGQQRKAVIARDRGCAWPGCDAHARWSEVHHIRWWERDAGPTSVDNGVLLCRFHHHEVHRRDLSITRVGARLVDGSPPEMVDAGRIADIGVFMPMGYEFRDRGGRVVGEHRAAVVSSDGPAAMPTAVNNADERGGEVPAPGRRRKSPPRRAPDLTPTAPAVRMREEVVAELDLTPTTDPMTGARVPAFFLSR
jgi:hypothetical protein